MEWYLQSACEDVSMMSFLDLAKSYQLKGRTTEELCRQNAAVASFLNKQQVRTIHYCVFQVYLYIKTMGKGDKSTNHRAYVLDEKTFWTFTWHQYHLEQMSCRLSSMQINKNILFFTQIWELNFFVKQDIGQTNWNVEKN